ncbi:hypothetical protein [Cryobacterium sp. Y57]|uniref:hypothetical protein n=1 Tax=Cryobacterium sp. Y57 TaxID=2048287 RepID=UPI000CE46FB4|nr:hypothetical protein [Cryobacterium sp. Y57]
MLDDAAGVTGNIVEVPPSRGSLMPASDVLRAGPVPPLGLRDRCEAGSGGSTLSLKACFQLARLLSCTRFALSCQLLAQPSEAFSEL